MSAQSGAADSKATEPSKCDESSDDTRYAVVVWGCNDDGQLGQGFAGTEQACFTPSFIPTFVDAKISITQVSAGSRHCLALSAKGKAYSWGWGECGQLGLGPVPNSNVPLQIEADDVLAVAAGGCHSALLRRDGSVLTFGDNSFGQLGLGRAVISAHIFLPTPVPLRAVLAEGEKVVALSCGGCHTMTLTDTGCMIGWGRGDNGQLGIGKGWLMKPANAGKLGPGQAHRVVFPEGVKVAAIACGAFHTAAVSTAGTLYTWGKDDYGMLGHVGLRSADLHKPHSVTCDSTFASVACGGWHTVAITTEGTVVVFGRGEYGRLGLGDGKSQLQPVTVPKVAGAVAASCGGTHTLVRTSDGSCLTFGRGDHGRLGQGNQKTWTTPVSPLLRVAAADAECVAVEAGGTFSIALVKTDCL